MYEQLFAANPALATLFEPADQASGEQSRRLAAAILAFAQHVERLDALTGAIEKIAAPHVATHVRPEHYGQVAQALLPAIADILGAAASDEVLAAWGESYWLLADVLKGREAELTRIAA